MDFNNDYETIDSEIKKLKVNARCPYCHKKKIVHFLYEPSTNSLKELERKKIIKLADVAFSWNHSPKYYCYSCHRPIFDDSKICPICWHHIDDKMTRTCSFCGWKRDSYQEDNLQDTWGCNVISYDHYQDNWLTILSLKLGNPIIVYPLDFKTECFEGTYVAHLSVKNSPNNTPSIVLKTNQGTEEIIPIWRIQAISKLENYEVTEDTLNEVIVPEVAKDEVNCLQQAFKLKKD